MSAAWIHGAAMTAALALAGAWLPGCAPEDGPVAVPWDHAACAECRMLVGDPRFAAQLRTVEGERRYFDDPGCLLIHLAKETPETRGVWLHHAHEDRWLRFEETGFVPLGPSPMGYDLGAVALATQHALGPAAALQRLREATATGEEAP